MSVGKVRVGKVGVGKVGVGKIGAGKIGVGKDFSGECLNDCIFAPGIERQTGFEAGLVEKSLPIPAIFGGHLGEEQATAGADGDHQAVPAYLDCAGMNRE